MSIVVPEPEGKDGSGSVDALVGIWVSDGFENMDALYEAMGNSLFSCQ